MAKTFSIEYEGKKYTLGFNRDTSGMLQKQGFDMDKIQAEMLVQVPLLFYGAFLANHPTMSKAKADAIWEHMTRKTDLLAALCEMYAEPIMTLMDEPKENEGNVTWAANW